MADGTHRDFKRLNEEAEDLLRQGRHPEAIETLRRLLYDDMENEDAIWNLARALSADGQHAAALIWYRRAERYWPDSRTLRRATTDVLLRREYYADALAEMRGLSNRALPPFPQWEGEPLKKGSLLVYDPTETDEEAALLGLLSIPKLLKDGVQVVLHCPPPLADLAGTVCEGADIVTDLPAEDAGDGAGIQACVRIDHLPLAIANAPRHISAPETKRGDDGAILIAAAGDGRVPGLDQTTLDKLSETLGPDAAIVSGREDHLERSTRVRAAARVVTDDGPTALLAAATGVPTLYVLPADPDWWWGDRGPACPWSPHIRLLRRHPEADPANLADRILTVLDEDWSEASNVPPLRPKDSAPDVAEAVDRVAPYFGKVTDRQPRIKELTGGTRNQVLKVSVKKEGGKEGYDDRVLRVSSYPPWRKNAFSSEINNMVIAGKSGVGPALYFSDPLDGTMLSEFIHGKAMDTKSMRRNKANAVTIAHLYRRLHRLSGFTHRWELWSKVNSLVDRMERKKAPAYLEREKENKLVAELQDILVANGVPYTPTHNDPLSRNFMKTKDRIVIIDWETSGMGDPHWDVGALSSQSGLKGDIRDAYLAAYFGREDHPAACRIRLMEAVCRYYWWADAIVEGIKRPEDSQWQIDAKDWWAWFEETVGQDDFDACVEAARAYRWSEQDGPPPLEADNNS